MENPPPSSKKPMGSSPFPKSWLGRLGGLLFSLIFFAGGVLALWNMTLKPTLRWWNARGWVEELATIERLELESGSGNEGGTVYSIVTTFSYRHQGRKFHSSEFGFNPHKTNIGVDGMRETVRNLKAQRQPTCWVNPAQPAEAVLDPSLPQGVGVGVFFCLPFLLVGIGGTTWMLFGPTLIEKRRERRSQLLADLSGRGIVHPEVGAISRHSGADEANYVFARSQSLNDAAIMTGVMLFWNGIVCVFLSVLVTEWLHGKTEWFLAIFLIPFVVIGVCLLLIAISAWRSVMMRDFVAVMMPPPTLQAGKVRLSLALLFPGSETRELPVSFELIAKAVVLAEANDGTSATKGSIRLPWKKTACEGMDDHNPGKLLKKDHLLARVKIPGSHGDFELELPSMPDHRGVSTMGWLCRWELRFTDVGGFSRDYPFEPW